MKELFKEHNALSLSLSVKEKSLSAPPVGREWATSQTANVGDRMNPGIRILPKCQQPFRRADERVMVRTTSCPYDKKLSLRSDKPQVGQRPEDVERKREYYRIIIFAEKI